MDRLRKISIFAVILMVFAIPANAESPWPMFRHDQQHTGRTQFTGPATPDLFWTFQANDAITASATIGHNGTIYVGAGGYFGGGGNSSMYAINPDGTLKWEYKTDSGATYPQAAGIFSSAAIDDEGAIYFGSLDAHLYCIEDSVTYAKLRWRYMQHGWPFYASPIVDEFGTVYAGSLDFRFYAIGPDGTMRWEYPTNWCIFSSAIFDDSGLIYVGSKDHNLRSFRDVRPFGEVVWTHSVGTFFDGHLIDASPAMGDDGTIYVGSDPYGTSGQTPVPVDTTFWAINPNGTRKWAFVMGDGVESSPAIGHDGTIYVGSYDSCVYAIEDHGTEGVLKWKFKTGGPVDASPTVDGDGIIYIGSRDSIMYALYPEDGSVKWSFPTEGGIESSVTIDDNGYIYFGSFDGKLYALGTGAPDVGLVAIEMPSQIAVNSVFAPVGRAANFRGYLTDLQVICTISDSDFVVYVDTVELTGAPSGPWNYAIFDPWTVGPDTGKTYSISMYTVLPGDDNTENDAMASMISTVPEPILACADINADGTGPDIADLIFLVNYMFLEGPPPPFMESTDVDGNGEGPDIGDLIHLVTFMFLDGPPPDCQF